MILRQVLSTLSLAGVRRRRKLRRSRPTPVADLQMGRPQLVRGRARQAADIVVAPASGSRCLCYQLVLEYLRETPDMTTAWAQVASAQAGTHTEGRQRLASQA